MSSTTLESNPSQAPTIQEESQDNKLHISFIFLPVRTPLESLLLSGAINHLSVVWTDV